MSRTSRRPEPLLYDDPLAEQLAWLMDSSIGIGRYSIGLDALVGLVPGFGDFLTGLVGMWIVLRAIRGGAHRAAILRMLVNLGIDSLVGSIPVAGDLFDFAFKANVRNLKIYRESVSGTRAPLKDWGFIVVVVLILLLMMALPILGLLFIVQWITS